MPMEVTNKVNSMGTLDIPTIISLSSGILILIIYSIKTFRKNRTRGHIWTESYCLEVSDKKVVQLNLINVWSPLDKQWHCLT